MRKKILIVSLALLAAILLSACGATNWPGLSSATDVAYLTNTTEVYAIDVKSGVKLWGFTGEKGGFFSRKQPLFTATPIVTEDGLVIVPDSGNSYTIYALDSKDINPDDKTPHIKWKFTVAGGHWIAPPLIIENSLFAPNSNGNVYVLDLQDGQSEKTATEVIKLSGSAEQTNRLWAQPVTDGERLFVTSLDHRIFAIDLQTFDVIWQEQLDGAIPGGPALGADGKLYVGSIAKKLERFDPLTGQHESVKDTNDWVWSTPLVEGENLYFSDVAGYFYSFNTTTGDWNWEPVKLDGAITASPLRFGDGLLVAAESGDIFSIADDGTVSVWHQLDAKGKAYTTPVLAGDYVLVAYIESDYYVIALDQDGDVKWTFNGK